MPLKHAYLIIAHNKWNQLSLLLSLLDDARNDIFVHIDKRAGAYPKELLMKSVKQSGLFFIERKKVYWADYSVADVELDLMQAASDHSHYQYYHLLSGMDLPLKTQDEIHAFFENETHEFIGMTIDGGTYAEKHACYYHLFLHNRYYRTCKPLKALDRGLMYLQRFLGIKRVYDKNLKISTGWQWFSITDSFCRYVLSERPFIKKMFSYVLDVDEKFMGTMINKLGDYNRVYHIAKPGEGDQGYREGCRRYVDFGRPVPQPYTWGRDDLQKDFRELMDSGMLFARKFDENVNPEIIQMVVDHLRNQTDSIS